MKKIVTIGGGTGSFTLLSGLKNYNVDISAVVSMADDGGSTGRLRDELGVLPPGDIRQCLVALSNSSDKLRELMNYRFPVQKGLSFKKDKGVGGHNFGNLLLSALEKISGNFIDGVGEAAKILNIKGKVLPVSEKDMNLAIELGNGKVIVGEKYLDHNEQVRKYGVQKVFLKPEVDANKKVIKHIKKADAIILGPGDHYGSIIPNLLVKDVARAVCEAKAVVIYNCNLTNKKGQTENFDVDKYTQEINKYLGLDRIDYTICSNKKPAMNVVKKYEKKEGKNSVVKFNKNKFKKRNYKVIEADVIKNNILIEEKKAHRGTNQYSLVRHDSHKLAELIITLLKKTN